MVLQYSDFPEMVYNFIGKVTTNLPGVIAPRKKDPQLFLLNTEIKMEGGPSLPFPEVP